MLFGAVMQVPWLKVWTSCNMFSLNFFLFQHFYELLIWQDNDNVQELSFWQYQNHILGLCNARDSTKMVNESGSRAQEKAKIVTMLGLKSLHHHHDGICEITVWNTMSSELCTMIHIICGLSKIAKIMKFPLWNLLLTATSVSWSIGL